MLRFSTRLRSRLHWLLPICGIGLLAWAVHAIWQVGASTGSLVLTCGAGGQATRRYELACSLAEHAATQGLDLQLIESAGSEDSLERVDSGQLDVAMISGGFDPQRFPNVCQVATIGTEPLHLFVRSEIVAAHREGEALLRHRRVNVGVPGSGSHALACDVLAFAGLAAKDEQGEGDLTRLELSNDELVARARAIQRADAAKRPALVADLPDAFVILNPLPSRTAQAMLAVADYQLVPLPFARSYRINGVRHVGQTTSLIDRQRVEETVIPAYTYRVNPAIPAEDCPTLGVKSLVVARRDVPPAALQRLIGTLYESRFSHEMPPENLLNAGSEFPPHTAVVSFLRAREPLVVKDFVEIVQKSLSALGAFSAGAIAVFGYYRRRRSQPPDAYLAEIGRIERLAHGKEPSPEVAMSPQEWIRQLQTELVAVKHRVIDDYAHGRLKGETNLANILALISDTRGELARIANASSSTGATRIMPRRVPSTL